MGNSLSQYCCFDKSTLLTTEHLTSRLNSSVIKHHSSPGSKIIRTTLENISASQRRINSPKIKLLGSSRNVSLKIGADQSVPGKKIFRRSQTTNFSSKENYLRRAKKRLRTEKLVAEEKILKIREDYRGRECFGRLCVENLKEIDSYIIRPDGDWEAQEEEIID